MHLAAADSEGEGGALRGVEHTPVLQPPFVLHLRVRIHFIIVMIRWTGLAPWEFGFPFPGSLTSTFLHAPVLQPALVLHLHLGFRV